MQNPTKSYIQYISFRNVSPYNNLCLISSAQRFWKVY